MGERVWSYFQGVTKNMSERDKMLGQILWKKGNEWTQTCGFMSVKHLWDRLWKENWKIDKLAIVAHGEQIAGRIMLERELSVNTIQYFKTEFKNIANYCMTSGGRLIFFSCAPAVGGEGDKLLCKLSEIMSNCEVVAFTKILETGRAGALDFTGTKAGKMWELGDSSKKNVNEYSSIAKWAKNGYVIKPPKAEVEMIQSIKAHNKRLNPKKLCGSMNCIGHAAYGTMCKNYIRHPRQYDQILKQVQFIKKLHNYYSVSIPWLIGVANEDGDLVLTGQRNRSLFGHVNRNKGTQRKRRPGSIGLHK